MGAEDTLALFIGAADLPARTVPAYLWGTAVSPFSIPTGGSMSELLALGTLKTVMLRVISKVPGTKYILPAFVTGIRGK